MKRTLIISTMLVLGLCFMSDVQAQNIHTGWRQKTIAVENGGEKPTVIQLLRAFNKVWHYKATDALLAEAGDKLYVSNDVTEGNSGRAFVDCEDFSAASTTITPRRRSSCRRMSRLSTSAPSGQALTSPMPLEKSICR